MHFPIFFHFLLLGFYQRPALQDEGSTQNVGSLEEIKKVNLEPHFFQYFNSYMYVKGCGTSSAFDTLRGQESRAYQQKSRGLKWFIFIFNFNLWTVILSRTYQGTCDAQRF